MQKSPTLMFLIEKIYDKILGSSGGSGCEGMSGHEDDVLASILHASAKSF